MSKRVMTYNDDGYLVGESHPRAKIPDEIVDQMRDLREAEDDEARERGLIGEEEDLPQHLRKWTYKALAKKFGFSIWTVRDIIKYRTRCHTVSHTKIIDDKRMAANIA